MLVLRVVCIFGDCVLFYFVWLVTFGFTLLFVGFVGIFFLLVLWDLLFCFDFELCYYVVLIWFCRRWLVCCVGCSAAWLGFDLCLLFVLDFLCGFVSGWDCFC